MSIIDFNFQRYIAFRKGAKQAQIREGASYAFSADLRMFRKIQRLGPIPSLLEEATRFFQKQALPQLLKNATLATPEFGAEIFFAMEQCAKQLHILTPPVYITHDPSIVFPITLGVLEESYVFIPESWAGRFSKDEWLHVLGIQGGHIQNAHVPLLTTWYYLSASTSGVIRFLALPAKSILGVWLKRAQITGNRAGFLCTRSLEVSISALKKMLLPEAERNLWEQALVLFSQTQYVYSLQNQPGGNSMEACDEKIALLFDRNRKPQEKVS